MPIFDVIFYSRSLIYSKTFSNIWWIKSSKFLLVFNNMQCIHTSSLRLRHIFRWNLWSHVPKQILLKTFMSRGYRQLSRYREDTFHKAKPLEINWIELNWTAEDNPPPGNLVSAINAERYWQIPMHPEKRWLWRVLYGGSTSPKPFQPLVAYHTALLWVWAGNASSQWYWDIVRRLWTRRCSVPQEWNEGHMYCGKL